MIEQEKALACNQRCCLFLDGRAVTEEEFTAATTEPINDEENIFHFMLMPCLKNERDRDVARELGFYLARPIEGSARTSGPSSFPTLFSKRKFVYDATTNRFLEKANHTHVKQWRDAVMHCRPDVVTAEYSRTIPLILPTRSI